MQTETPSSELWTEDLILKFEDCFGRYVREGDAEPTWVIPGFIHSGITCITGQPEQGKTTLLISMVKGLLAGSWLGEVCQLPADAVILFGCEDADSARKVRRAFDGENRVKVFTLKNWNPAGMAEVLQEGGVGLVILDSLYAIVTDLNDQSECGRFIKTLHSLDVPVVVVHHAAKGSTTGAAGAQGYRAAYRHTIQLKIRTSDGDASIIQLTTSGNDVQSASVEIELNRTTFSVACVTNTRAKNKGSRLSQVDKSRALARVALARGVATDHRSSNDIASDLVGGRHGREDSTLSSEVAQALGFPSVKFRTVTNTIKNQRAAFDEEIRDGLGVN